MRSVTRTLLRVGALAGAGLAAEKAAARHVRSRRRTDDDLLRPPEDVRHLTVPSHDGGSLHLLERGEGRPVLLVHGITLNAELWSPQLHELAADFRVLSLDQRGHGRSTAGDEGYDMTVLGRDIATVLTRLDLRDALVVGHSMGGMAALNFAVDHPDVLRERVSGLGLVATAAARPVVPLLVPRATALGALIVERLDSGKPVRGLRFSGNDLSLFLIRSVFGKAPSAAAIEQVRASIESTDEEAVQRCLAGILHDHDTTHRLGEVDVPAFVVVGSRDILTPPTFARQMVDHLPDAELTVLPQAGHQLMQERPDDVARLIRDLAERTEGAGGALAPTGS
ncbi:alpha/beta fold hydrolase [Iamia sp. SCSIO 61187]|uniref:alpha/beta fold hydrolase n=1 Tax=Iamia sp. SCSIO 61187 TaxID=2722752 RepID=UPI001C625F93|nr:alpha/beta fold hydrolase [Iamia sp. SCSIO 61187]QYG94776.1 alpha/beta fold hydrolase [Iamia sp. SCSIO 61187]